MVSLSAFLMLIALILLFLAAIGVSSPRISLGWLGMFFWALDVSLHLFTH